MKVIEVKSRSGKYSVSIGRGLLARTGQILRRSRLSGKVMVVTQAGIWRRYGKALGQSLRLAGYPVSVCFVPDSETAKSEKELFRIHRELVRSRFERRDTMLAFGGGVVGDLTGFAAATYLRGVPFVNAGTTLLAQVDSSIGGKTGINLPEGKNLVGAFYPPQAVISDVATLGTLPERELRASLAEVIKYGVIRDAALFAFLERRASRILAGDIRLLEKIVATCAAIKAAVVGRDEFETGQERMILNFGHTFGHGFEQAGGYRKFLHGEAVALGMVCAAKLSVTLGLLKEADERRIEKLIERLGLPISSGGLGLKTRAVVRAMGRDKKIKEGRLRFVLPVRIGKVIVKGGLPSELAEKSVADVNCP
ncbi:MAG: 3-dehydroquinate synthase [Candidatus Omnitrophota bacterium]|jgi:3-dehydroquinate synthase